MDKPKVIERFADNGEHSHWELIDVETGGVLWSENARRRIVITGVGASDVAKRLDTAKLDADVLVLTDRPSATFPTSTDTYVINRVEMPDFQLIANEKEIKRAEKLKAQPWKRQGKRFF